MWIGNAALVLPETVLENGAVRIEDGFIAEIVDRPVAAPDIDASGLVLMPGIVDLHGDMIEREIQPRPSALFPFDMAVVEIDKRHASAGVTTGFVAVSFHEDVLAARGVRSEQSAKEIIDTLAALRPSLTTDMRVHARFEINNAHAEPILRDLIGRETIDLVSLMDHTPGHGQSRDIEHFVALVARADGLDQSAAAEKANALLAARQAKPDIWNHLSAFAALAKAKGLVIASHDDDTADKVALMHKLGASISEFPVSSEAAEHAKRLGMHTVMGAPNALRGTSTADNLSARAALRHGVLDALASDYHASAMLQAAFTLQAEKIAPLHQAVGFVTGAPAKAAGLTDRGEIAAGKRADLALVDGGSPPRVVGTFRGGRLIYGEPSLFDRMAGGVLAGGRPASGVRPPHQAHA